MCSNPVQLEVHLVGAFVLFLLLNKARMCVMFKIDVGYPVFRCFSMMNCVPFDFVQSGFPFIESFLKMKHWEVGT